MAKRNSVKEIASLLALMASDVAEERAQGIAGICTAYENLVQTMATRYTQATVERDDLVQEARLGLLEACKTFKTKRVNGAPVRYFSEHARWCVRHALAEYLAGVPNPFRLPSDLVRRLSKLRRVAQELESSLGRRPTLEEISDAVGLSLERTLAMLEYEDGAVSLNMPWGNSGMDVSTSNHKELADFVPSSEPTPEERLIAIEDYERAASQDYLSTCEAPQSARRRGGRDHLTVLRGGKSTAR